MHIEIIVAFCSKINILVRDINWEGRVHIMAVRVVEFLSGGYKIRKIFA